MSMGWCAHRWVRCLAFDSSNEWFVTGSADRTIRVWDLASGQLKLTLTGHIEQVCSVYPSTFASLRRGGYFVCYTQYPSAALFLVQNH